MRRGPGAVLAAIVLASAALAPAHAPAAAAAATIGATGTSGASGTSGAPAGQAPRTPRERFHARYVGRPAPDFTLKDLKGKPHTLSSLRGKVVLLNFWYSSCGPCRREIPDLATLHRMHAGKGLEILGINLDDLLIPDPRRASLQVFMAEFKVPYPVLLADAEVFELYGGVPVQPITFLVDRHGTVAKIFWGAYPGQAIDKAVAPYLAAPSRP